MSIKYELTKSIGFKLQPVQNEGLEKEIKQLQAQAEANQSRRGSLALFVKQAEKFIRCFEDWIFSDHSNAQQNPKNQRGDDRSNEAGNTSCLRADIYIKTKWLLNYTSSEFRSWSGEKQWEGKYLIRGIPYLKNLLEECIAEWKKTIRGLKDDLEAPEEDLKRRSQTALLTSRFSKKQIFPLLCDFVYDSNPKEDERPKEHLKKLLEKIKSSLISVKKIYLPFQSTGLVLAKASFNYYTVDKKPINYEEEIKKYNKIINSANRSDCTEGKISKNRSAIRIQPEFHQMIKQWMKDNVTGETTREFLTRNKLDDKSDLKKLSLKTAYNLIKYYKGQAKKLFEEDMSRCLYRSNLKSEVFLGEKISQSSKQIGTTYKDIKTKHPLFDSTEEKYEKFKAQTKKIEEINRQMEKVKDTASSWKKIKNLREERAKIKKQRGKFFQSRANPYKAICKNYEEVAKKFGKYNAMLRGIEKEKEESQLLNYWALILEKQGRHELLLIHREDRRKAKRLIESNQAVDQKSYPSHLKIPVFSESEKPDNSNRINICQFYSLTLRALDKLCFGFLQGMKDTDFLKEIKKELPEYSNLKEKFSFRSDPSHSRGNFKNRDFVKKGVSQKTNPDQDEGEIDEKKLIEFYQKVLKSAYAKKVLEIQFFHGLEQVLNGEFQSLNKFRSALEKVCYLKKIDPINEEIKNKLLKMEKSCLFKISSYDLSLYDKGIKLRHHTRLWKEFWLEKNEEAHYPIRLNPEISIFWREKQDYRFTKGKYKTVKRNRFLKAEWRLKTSLTLNAATKKVQLSFKDQNRIKKEVVEFNRKFYKNLANKPMCYYGVDQGLKELATLCIIKEADFLLKNESKGQQKNRKNSKLKTKEECDADFPPLELYSLKEEYYNYKIPEKKHKAIYNPSYFINNSNLFKIIKKPTLDLTTAKLIDGKIVENGDVLTYLKFKELSAKRQLFRYKSEIRDNKIYFSEEKKSFYINITNRGQEKKEFIYYFREDFKKILPKENIEQELQDYLDSPRENRYKNNPLAEKKINHLREALASNMSGILSFLYKKNPGLIILETGQSGRNKSKDESISVQLGWALYKKFQTEGLVPPYLKEVDFLLKNEKQRRNKNNFDRVENSGLSGEEKTGQFKPDSHNKKMDCPRKVDSC